MFFRELKGQFGLQDYQGMKFRSYERYVTLSLLGYLVLEHERWRRLQGQAEGEAPRAGWAGARTAVLLQHLRLQATRADVHWMEERLRTRSGRRQLRQALRQAHGGPPRTPPANTAGRRQAKKARQPAENAVSQGPAHGKAQRHWLHCKTRRAPATQCNAAHSEQVLAGQGLISFFGGFVAPPPPPCAAPLSTPGPPHS